MVDKYLDLLKNKMLDSRREFQVSFMKSVRLVFISIIGVLFSILCMYAAATERHTTIKTMISNHIFGGEWLVILLIICLVLYTFMMILNCYIVYKTFEHDKYQYKKYRKVLKDNIKKDQDLFNYNNEVEEVC